MLHITARHDPCCRLHLSAGGLYHPVMALRTNAVQVALARGWSIADLQQRSGLSLRALYYLRDGRTPKAATITALLRAFPDLTFEELFVDEPEQDRQSPPAGRLSHAHLLHADARAVYA